MICRTITVTSYERHGVWNTEARFFVKQLVHTSNKAKAAKLHKQWLAFVYVYVVVVVVMGGPPFISVHMSEA